MKRVRNNKKQIMDFSVAQEIDTDVYRKIPSDEMYQVESAKSVVDFVTPNWECMDYTETMKAVYMNRRNKIIGTKVISTGGIDSVLVDVRVIFQAALLCNASSFILVHNHPSGALMPSSGDIQLTRKVLEAGKIMDIKLLDHIIISDAGYYSFADSGEL